MEKPHIEYRTSFLCTTFAEHLLKKAKNHIIHVLYSLHEKRQLFFRFLLILFFFHTVSFLYLFFSLSFLIFSHHHTLSLALILSLSSSNASHFQQQLQWSLMELLGAGGTPAWGHPSFLCQEPTPAETFVMCAPIFLQ